MERMELEGIVGQANHAGKREILVGEEEDGYRITSALRSLRVRSSRRKRYLSGANQRRKSAGKPARRRD